MKVLISGGHPSPALALIDYLSQAYPEVEIHFVGREVSQLTTSQRATEVDAIAERKLPFYPIATGKLGHGNVLDRFSSAIAFAHAVIYARELVSQIKPDIFISFGSYVAAPVALACWSHHVPIITHEQTRVAGISNQLIAKFADKVALSYVDSARYFPQQKTIVTGLPLRPQLFNGTTAAPSWVTRDSSVPLLYVAGGSTGSHALNHLVIAALPQLVEKWQVIHVCGAATAIHNWNDLLSRARQALPADRQKHYIFQEQVRASELRWIYQQDTLFCGRSGANTVAEITAFDLPAVFIPLPNSRSDEQTVNAQSRVTIDRALILPQAEATTESLLATLTKTKQLLDQPRQLHPDEQAATVKLWQLALEVMQARSP